MAPPQAEIVPGTLELLILAALAEAPMHGWGLAQIIKQRSDDVFKVNQGTMYPALQRLKRRGAVRAEWRMSENNRRARYYSLTPAGRVQLGRARLEWARTTAAVAAVIRAPQLEGTI